VDAEPGGAARHRGQTSGLPASCAAPSGPQENPAEQNLHAGMRVGLAPVDRCTWYRAHATAKDEQGPASPALTAAAVDAVHAHAELRTCR